MPPICTVSDLVQQRFAHCPAEGMSSSDSIGYVRWSACVPLHPRTYEHTPKIALITMTAPAVTGSSAPAATARAFVATLWPGSRIRCHSQHPTSERREGLGNLTRVSSNRMLPSGNRPPAKSAHRQVTPPCIRRAHDPPRPSKIASGHDCNRIAARMKSDCGNVWGGYAGALWLRGCRAFPDVGFRAAGFSPRGLPGFGPVSVSREPLHENGICFSRRFPPLPKTGLRTSVTSLIPSR